MITVSLHGAEFFAFHGYYPEEQKLGNRFFVDVDVSFAASVSLEEDDLANTVNYEQLYEIADEQMKQTKKLIETVAYAIANEVKERYPFLKSIGVSIKKPNLPLKGKVEYSCVKVTA